MTKSRAYVRDEQTGQNPFFVYVQTPVGISAACRFATRENAQAVADAMNDAYESEGRLYRLSDDWTTA